MTPTHVYAVATAAYKGTWTARLFLGVHVEEVHRRAHAIDQCITLSTVDRTVTGSVVECRSEQIEKLHERIAREMGLSWRCTVSRSRPSARRGRVDDVLGNPACAGIDGIARQHPKHHARSAFSTSRERS